MIAYLLKKFPRLSETFVLNEILGQESLGRDLHVFSRREPDEEPRHPELQALRANVEVLPQGAEMDPWKLLFDPPHGYEIELAGLQPLVREVASYGHPRASKLLTEALWLRGRCAELGIRHLHVHFATDSAITAMLLHEMGGPSYSLTAHAKDIYRSTVDPRLLARIVERSSFTVTVCDANVAHLESLLPANAAERVRRLYNGVDLGAFEVDDTRRASNEILAVGRLVPKKGFDVYIRALAALKSSGIDFRASLVGQGELEADLRDLATRLGLDEELEFTGPLDQAQVRQRLATATVFCLPCRIGEDGNRDALPTVLLEALASGVPCISTRVTGVPEILDQGQAGRLLSPDDVDGVKEALSDLLSSSGERAKLAERGRARARELFDSRAVARVLHGWHQEALESRSVR